MSHMHFLERQPSTADRFAKAFGNLGQTAAKVIPEYYLAEEAKKQQQQKALQQREAINRLTGLDISGIDDPKMQQAILEHALQGQQKAQEQASKLKEGGSGLKTVGSAINKLESLISKKGIGFTGMINPSSEARFNRGEFEATTSALMPLFKSMFPRGMTEKEFKFVNDHYIPQSSDTEEKIRGKLSALKNLYASQQEGDIQSEEETEDFSEPKELNEEAIIKIRKIAGNNEKEARRIAKKMGYKW